MRAAAGQLPVVCESVMRAAAGQPPAAQPANAPPPLLRLPMRCGSNTQLCALLLDQEASMALDKLLSGCMQHKKDALER